MIDYPNDLNKIPMMRIELMTLGLLDPRSNQLSYIGGSGDLTNRTIVITTNYTAVK